MRPRRVVELDSRPLVEGGGLHDFALGAEPVEDVPGELHAGDPAVDLVGQVRAEDRAVSLVAAKGLQAGLVAGFGVDDVFLAQGLGLAQRGQLGAPFQRQDDGAGEAQREGLGLELVGEVKGDVLERVLGDVEAEQLTRTFLAMR